MLNVELEIEIIPNENNPEGEDWCDVRTRFSYGRTWTLVVNGVFFGEYDTEEEVVAQAARLAAETATKHCV